MLLIRQQEEGSHIEKWTSKAQGNINNRLLTRFLKHRGVEMEDTRVCQGGSDMVKSQKWKRTNQTQRRTMSWKTCLRAFHPRTSTKVSKANKNRSYKIEQSHALQQWGHQLLLFNNRERQKSLNKQWERSRSIFAARFHDRPRGQIIQIQGLQRRAGKSSNKKSSRSIKTE